MPDKKDKPGLDKISKVMHEYKAGTLKSGSGHKVVDKDQAVAIAISESKRKRSRRY